MSNKFDEMAKKHLMNSYWINNPELQRKPIGTWRGVSKGHIIPKEIKELNIISHYRSSISKNIEDQKVKLHTYFHHLNSSQAMGLNFFCPFLTDLLLKDVLISVINDLGSKPLINQSNPISFLFEYISTKDNGYAGQNPTNFDLCVVQDDVKVFFEIKYCEDGFGKVSKNDYKSHWDKYQRMYKGLASKVIQDKFNNPEFFLTNYQLMRNLVHIDNSCYLILLYPSKNTKVNNQATQAMNYLRNEYKSRLICITWEDLFNKTIAALEDTGLLVDNIMHHLTEFEIKYLAF